jgi:hypothetical protein
MMRFRMNEILRQFVDGRDPQCPLNVDSSLRRNAKSGHSARRGERVKSTRTLGLRSEEILRARPLEGKKAAGDASSWGNDSRRSELR